MHLLKIKDQFNTVFIFIMMFALLSLLITNFFANKVSASYQNVLNHAIPILHKASELTQISAHIESNLIQVHFDAINIGETDLTHKEIIHLVKLWMKSSDLLKELSKYKLIDESIIINEQKKIDEYIITIQELKRQINLLIKANKQQQNYNVDIETIINYNNKILLAEIESFWNETIQKDLTKEYLDELEYSNQFYKNSAQLLSYFRQALLSTNIQTLNILKRDSVKLYKQMQNSGSSKYEYKLFADALLEQVKPLYSGENSLFNVRYNVLRLNNITNTLIHQQIVTAKKVEEISNQIILAIQKNLAKQKNEIRDNLYKSNKYFILIIILIFIISVFTLWFLVNKNLIERLTKIRSQILELSKGNDKIKIKAHKKDEIGDMEDALEQLKGYVAKAKHLSTTDALTQLLNHSQFKKNLNIEIRRHTRHKEALCLAIVDIDFFKNYNDLYGHPMGDVCLKQVSKLLQDSCHRAGEYAYRIGGEEFALIIPTTNSTEISQKLKELKENLQKANIVHENSSISDILTISIGVYCTNDNKYISTEEFYQRADDALYEAKIKRDSIIIKENMK